MARRILLALACMLALLAGYASPSPGASPFSWSPPDLIDEQPPFANTKEVFSVACPSVSLCVAVDGGGQASTSTNPTGGRAAWNTKAVDSSSLYGVSCPSTTLCVATGNGRVATSTNPTGDASAWA